MTEETSEPKETPVATEWGPPWRPQYSAPQEGGAEVRQKGKVAQLSAIRCFGYGEPIAREMPLLRVPADAKTFLFSVGTEVMKEVAKRLGDVSRMAGFLAFMRLTESEREQVLALGVSSGCKVAEETLQILGMFLKDFPQFKTGIDWELFAKVVAIINDRGSKMPSGEYVLYGLSGAAAHSFTPNAVIERRGDQGEKELRVLAYSGISADEEITVSYASEDTLFLPREERKAALAKAGSPNVAEGGSVEAAEALLPLLERVRKVAPKRGDKELAEREGDLRRLLEDLRSVDKGLPFAMAAKARARTNLASAFEDCGDAANLKVAISLYEAAMEDQEVVLGAGSRTIVENLKRRIKTLQDQLDT